MEYDFNHFRYKSPFPFPVKPLVKPLPVSTSGRILPRTADLLFDSLLCMFDSFLRLISCLRSSIYFFCPVRLMLVQLYLFLCVSLYLYAVQFIFVRFDSFVCGLIYFCAGSIQFLFGSIYFLGRSIYFCVVRFIFCCFAFL